MKIRYYSC